MAAALNVTVPEPVPDAPPVTVSHVALLTAVHEQPTVAVTAIELVPPALDMLTLVGLMLYVQAGVVPDCVTVNVCPATVIVPVR